MISRLTGTATLLVVVAVAVLRALDRVSWQGVLAAVLGVLGVRIAVIAWGAARRELPWTRLLLPTIILVEAVGVSWQGSAALWQVRLGTALALELAFIVVAIRELRRSTAGDAPLETRIASAFEALLPARAARLIAFELVIMGSALRFVAGGWRRAVPAGFTYHRESGLRSFLPILPLLVVGDVLLLELVILPHASAWVRVVVHGVAIYGVIWMIGLYASLRARPHRLVDGRLTLHRGMLRSLVVPVDQIAAIDKPPSFSDDWKKRAYCKGAIRVDIAGPTVLELTLRDAARPLGVLGEGAPSTRVLVAVDDPTAFTAELTRAIPLSLA